MRKVEHIMGMPVTIDIPDCPDTTIFDKAFGLLREIDAQFSNYKPKSEMSQFIRGNLKEANFSKGLRAILLGCKNASEQTNGYFSASIEGVFDANGYIKGWAINQTADCIIGLGATTFCIGAGGDILAKGVKKWKIGIQDPFNKQVVYKTIELKNQAIATSGSYEKGPHIINPKTKKPADYWASVSVVGPAIIQADVFATACFAMGEEAINFIKSFPDYSLIAILNDNELLNRIPENNR